MPPVPTSPFTLLYDPGRPLKMGLPEDRSLYTSLDSLRASPTCPPIQQIRYAIEQSDPADNTAHLLIAPAGSGRTTELSRLQFGMERNHEEPTRVVWVDLTRWLDVRRITSILHVLRAITCSVEDLVGEEGPFSHYLLELLRHHPALKGLAIGDMQSFHTRMRTESTTRRTVDLVLREEFPEYVAMAHNSIQSTLARLHYQGVIRLVVVVEGLDRVGRVDPSELVVSGGGLDHDDTPWSRAIRNQKKEIQAEWATYEQSIERMLIDHAPALHIPSHIILAVPGWLQNIRPTLQNRWSGGVVELSGIQCEGSPKELPILAELLEKRVSGTVEGWTRLWRASGGGLRDFLWLVQDASRGGGVDRAIRSMKERYQRLWPLYEPAGGSTSGMSPRELWRAADRGFYQWDPSGLVKRQLWEEQ